jgi:hypothetical protein
MTTMPNRWAKTTSSAKRKSCLALLGGLAIACSGAYVVYAAVERQEGKPRVPTPSITAKPAKHSREKWASFRFKDNWQGATFLCSLDGSRYTGCASPKRYSGPLRKGRHSFRVRARIPAPKHKLSPSASSIWLVQRLSPTPSITQHPADPTRSSSAAFAFRDRHHHASFRCRLDGSPWRRCSSPIHLSRLGLGKHHFYVYVHANHPSDIRSHVARFDWNVVAQSSESFSISAGVIGSLYPGAAPHSIPLTLRNSNGVPIYVTELTVAVTNSPPGCSSSTNISLSQSSASATIPVLIQANGSVTLPAQGVTAPTIQLVDLPVNQDACKGATFSLSFTGSAHS